MPDLTCLYQINVQACSLGTQIPTNARKCVWINSSVDNVVPVLMIPHCVCSMARRQCTWQLVEAMLTSSSSYRPKEWMSMS